MSFDKNTKSFLLHLLNEAGGVGTLSDEGLNMQEYGYDFNQSFPGPKKKTKKGEEDFYKSQLKTALGTVTGGLVDTEKEAPTSPSLGYLAGLGTLKRTMGYKTSPESGAELIDLAPKVTSAGLPDLHGTAKKLAGRAIGLGTATAALNVGMGQLGQKLAGKLPYLTALGVDPLDYATKIMGVDYVANELSKLPTRQYRQMTSGGGYFKP